MLFANELKWTDVEEEDKFHQAYLRFFTPSFSLQKNDEHGPLTHKPFVELFVVVYALDVNKDKITDSQKHTSQSNEILYEFDEFFVLSRQIFC